MPCSGLLSGGLAESNLLSDGVGLLSMWVWLTFLLGGGLFLGGSALLYNWVWLSLGRFGGFELTCERIVFPSYLDLPYFLPGSGSLLWSVLAYLLRGSGLLLSGLAGRRLVLGRSGLLLPRSG